MTGESGCDYATKIAMAIDHFLAFRRKDSTHSTCSQLRRRDGTPHDRNSGYIEPGSSESSLCMFPPHGLNSRLLLKV